MNNEKTEKICYIQILPPFNSLKKIGEKDIWITPYFNERHQETHFSIYTQKENDEQKVLKKKYVWEFSSNISKEGLIKNLKNDDYTISNEIPYIVNI